MNFKRKQLSAIASGVALGIATMAATAADQPALTTASLAGTTTTTITGGATINNGASYLTTVPAADAVDLVATINVASADVGKSASMVVVVEVPGVGMFNMLSGGTFATLDAANIQAFETKTLSATSAWHSQCRRRTRYRRQRRCEPECNQE